MSNIHKDPSTRPMIRINGRTISPHRYIMENVLERPLQTYEVVHHIDFDFNNNKISNLVCMHQGQHSILHGHVRGFLGQTGLHVFMTEFINMKKCWYNAELMEYEWADDFWLWLGDPNVRKQIEQAHEQRTKLRAYYEANLNRIPEFATLLEQLKLDYIYERLCGSYE